jgi:hypothetical protein
LVVAAETEPGVEHDFDDPIPLCEQPGEHEPDDGMPPPEQPEPGEVPPPEQFDELPDDPPAPEQFGGGVPLPEQLEPVPLVHVGGGVCEFEPEQPVCAGLVLPIP